MPVPIIVTVTAFISSYWSKLGAMLFFLLPFVVEKVLTLLGVGVVTYYGFDLLFDQLEQEIYTRFAGLPSDVYQLCLIAGFDDVIAILFGAYAYTFTIKVVQSVFSKNGTYKNVTSGA